MQLGLTADTLHVISDSILGRPAFRVTRTLCLATELTAKAACDITSTDITLVQAELLPNSQGLSR